MDLATLTLKAIELQRQYDELIEADTVDMERLLALAAQMKALKQQISAAEAAEKAKKEKAKQAPKDSQAPTEETKVTISKQQDPPSEDLLNLATKAAKVVGVISVEITGSWAWVIVKNTYQSEKELNSLGFRIAKQKTRERQDGATVFYWGATNSKRKKRSNTPWEKIRSKYGSQRLDLDE